MNSIISKIFILISVSLLLGSELSDKVTLHAEGAPLSSVLAMLAEESGYNIVTGVGVNDKEKLTIHLTDVQIDQAINLVVRASGLSYEIVGNSILVANRSNIMEDVGVKPHVITLQYANPEEIKGLLSNVTSQITVEKSGNRLLIHASPKKIAEIEEIIRQVDVPALQIMLEARLIEVSLSDQETMGIDWAKLAKISYIVAEAGSPLEFSNGAASGSLIPGLTASQDETGQIMELLTPERTGLVDEMYFQRFSDGAIPFQNGAARQLTQFDVALDFLLRNNKAEILANSQVVTLNGHEAEISMVDVVPYILSSGGVGGQVKVQREEVGIKLKILPTVNSDGYITTSVTPEVSSIYDMIGPDRNIPHVKKRLSKTTIRVKDGETIIIAGLLSAGKRLDISKFPLLWRIPFIGDKFFTHRTEVIVKTDLIVQITPRIIHDNYSGIDKNQHHQAAEDDLEN